MSLFNIQINFEKSNLPKDILVNVTNTIAESFDEDVENVSGSLTANANIHWQGSPDPAIFLTVQTTRDLNAELNQKCSAALSKCLAQVSGVPAERIFVHFTEKVFSDVAVNGRLLLQST